MDKSIVELLDSNFVGPEKPQSIGKLKRFRTSDFHICHFFLLYKLSPRTDKWMLDVNKTKIEELNQRLSKLETHNNIEMLTLVEILANAAFFGKFKEDNCHFAKNGQCSYFILSNENENKVPLVSLCKIKKCLEPLPHFHIETSAITCSLCNQMLDKSHPTQNEEKRNTSGRKKHDC